MKHVWLAGDRSWIIKDDQEPPENYIEYLGLYKEFNPVCVDPKLSSKIYVVKNLGESSITVFKHNLNFTRSSRIGGDISYRGGILINKKDLIKLANAMDDEDDLLIF